MTAERYLGATWTWTTCEALDATDPAAFSMGIPAHWPHLNRTNQAKDEMQNAAVPPLQETPLSLKEEHHVELD